MLHYCTAAIKTFFKGSDFKPEANQAADAVEAAEEDLKDLKKINQQVRWGRCGSRGKAQAA